MKNLEFIKKGKDVLAIIIYDDFHLEGINFFTSDDSSQQLGFISYKTGKIIEPHTHKIVKREIFLTQEVLIIKKGKMKVDFYDSKNNYFDSRVLKGGDVILLTGGGHGCEVLEDLEMIEVKQGPYLGKRDKVLLKDIKEKKL